MRLYAHTLAKVWQQWDDVAAWRLDGPWLHIIFEGRSKASSAVEVINLPQEVIGLRDTSPVRHTTASSRSVHDRPAVENRADHGSVAHRLPERLRIPDREPPRARFGDSPRRRQFKGDGS